jgi:hypothetical protein
VSIYVCLVSDLFFPDSLTPRYQPVSNALVDYPKKFQNSSCIAPKKSLSYVADIKRNKLTLLIIYIHYYLLLSRRNFEFFFWFVYITFVTCSMRKGKLKLIPTTEKNSTYVTIGVKCYSVHEDVYNLIKMLLKENKRKVRKNERYEA